MITALLNKRKENSSKVTLSTGFTLIELLIVIVILAILSVVVIIAINPAERIATADNARVKSDLSSFATAAGTYNVDNSSYPTGFSATYVSSSIPTDPSGTAYTVLTAPTGCTGSDVTPCTSIAIYGNAYNDNSDVTNSTSYWCWRSSTGQVLLVATTAACTAP